MTESAEEFDIRLAPPRSAAVTAENWAWILEQALIDLQEIRLELRHRVRYSHINIRSSLAERSALRRGSYYRDDSPIRAFPSQGRGPRPARSVEFEEFNRRPSTRSAPSRVPVQRSQVRWEDDTSHGRHRGSDSEDSRASSKLQRTIINDDSIRSNLTRNYQLDPSTDVSRHGGGDGFSASESIRGDGAAVVVGVYDEEERHATAMRKLDGAVTSPGHGDPETINHLPGTTVTPFLMWGVSGVHSGGEEKQDGADNHSTVLARLVRLLQQIDKALSKHPLSRPAGRSSFKDLEASHEIMLRSLRHMDGSPSEPRLADQPSPELHGTLNQVDDATLKSTREEPGKMKETEDRICQNVAQLSRDIITRSKSLIGLFVPLSDTVARGIPWALDLYWGALDLMLKVCALRTSLMN